MQRDFLMHHGIKGQEWGVRNGPPYPLEGKKVRKTDYKLSRKGNKTRTIRKGHKTQTLSYDKDRIKDTNMYFASLTNRDKNYYKAWFNRKVPIEVKDEDGNVIGSSFGLKYNIRTEANKDARVANERDGVEAFSKLMSNSRDFSNFVLDKGRMESLMDERRKGYKAYSEAIDAIHKARESNEITSKDAALIYRMFNYVLGSQGPDIDRQKARFFNELKSNGFSAVLDTNDALYGKFKMDEPVIIFDTDSFDFLDNYMVSESDKTISKVKSILGI